MQDRISLKVNYLYNVAYQLLLIIAPLITSPIISRRLGPDMIGQQSYCYSVATYFMLFIMLGVSNYGNRSIAKVRDDKIKLSETFWTIYGFQLLRALIVFAGYIVYVVFFARRYHQIALINSIYVLSGFFDISWFFFGLEQFKLTVPVNFALKIINIIAISTFIKQPRDIWMYALIICAITLCTNMILWIYLKRFVFFYKPKLREFIPHIKPEFILFIPVLAVSLYKVMDRIMLGALSSSVEVGYYTQAESIVNLPMALITSLGVVMLPRISNLIAKGDVETSKKYIESSIMFAMLLACAMAFGLSSIAPTFAITFFGESFAPCGSLIIGLSSTIIFISWANVIRTQYLIPNSMDKSYLISIISGATVNLIINFLLIPRYASIGALIGTISAEAIVCILQTAMVRNDLPIKRYIVESTPFFLFVIIMFIFVRIITPLIDNPTPQLIAQVLLGGGIYGICLVIYSVVSKSFIAGMIKSILNKLKIRR